ncbi:MAG TPA: hypothetical protein VEK79_12035 [Thermoanaerobaculia bacterium]|nr:hypothetical protein [Thermoanaerobaculia bacterium]
MNLLSFVIDCVVAWSDLFLLAVAVSLLYYTNHVLHFGLLATFALAPYLMWSLGGVSFAFVGLLTAAVAGLLFASIDFRLQQRGAGGASLMIASIALWNITFNVLGLAAGHDAHVLPGLDASAHGSSLMSRYEVAAVVVSVAGAVIVATASKFSPTVLQVRAIAANYDLSVLCGADAPRLVRRGYIAAACCAGTAGMFEASKSALTPTMGTSTFFVGVVAAVLAGELDGRRLLVATGSLAVVRQAVLAFLPGTWSGTVTFALLLAALLLRVRQDRLVSGGPRA